MHSLILLLAALGGLASPPSTCATDVQEIITTIANESELAKWLDHYGYRPGAGLFFRYERPVVCGKVPLAAGAFNFSFKQTRQVTYIRTTRLDQSPEAVLIIESLVIDGNQATVKVRIPAEGVHGEFTLTRQAKWVVETAAVGES